MLEKLLMWCLITGLISGKAVGWLEMDSFFLAAFLSVLGSLELTVLCN